MNIPDIGDIVTPVDDPCQYNPAWRSIVAGYLFSVGLRTKDDFESLSKTGCVTVTRTVTDDGVIQAKNVADKSRGKKRRGRKKKGEKASDGTVVMKRRRRIVPFDTNPEYRAFALDKWIMAHVDMCNDEADGRPVSDASVPFKIAARWYVEMESEAALRKRLEPLLLTEVGMDIVTLDLTGMPSMQPAIEAYERMYFNCRDDNFNLSSSMQLIQRIAMPWGPLKTFLRKWEEVDAEGFVIGDGRPLAKDSDVWRAIAATMGYEALMYVWRWDRRAHGMKENSVEHMLDLSWKVAASRLFTDLYNGDIKHEDAARVLAAYTAQSKRISEDRHDGGEAEDTTAALLSVLCVAAPKMRALVEGGAGMITDNDIQTRIAAQQAIDKTSIQDAGKQVQDEIIEAQISDAIDG